MEPSPPSPRARCRWLRIAGRLAEVATLALAVGALGLWCAEENPTSRAFIDLRREDGSAAAQVGSDR